MTLRGQWLGSSDIEQGQGGTCYFLAALGALAHDRRGLVRQLVVAHDSEPLYIYIYGRIYHL
jgi:hypothetical protein